MINKKYKDRLFCLLFGNEEYKDNILSLYNALCNTSYTNTDDIQIYTIEDVIYIKMKNDVSILLDSFLYLWEQQSTFNPNMPIRGLLYFGKMYDKYITENHLNIYGKMLIKLPTPKYTVLYNGMDEQPAFMQLRLSDSFINPDTSGDFEWTANMINLNDGKNDDLLDKCQPLKEYMILINEIRKNSVSMGFEDAVDTAVTDCIEHNVLKSFYSSTERRCWTCVLQNIMKNHLLMAYVRKDKIFLQQWFCVCEMEKLRSRFWQVA